MLRNTIPESEEEITGRESRLKLILLAIALILVAGYTSMATSMGDYVLFQVARMLASPMLPLVLAGVGGFAVLGGLGYVLKRRLGGKLFRKSGKATELAIKIPGRQEFIKALESQIEIHAKEQRQFALHLVDIDRFKAVNALLGEAEGDALLKLVGERLMILVDQPERLARVGDDEFGVIQPEAGGARHAEIYARRIQDAVKDALAQVPQHARPGASIGIAISPDHGDSPNKLLHSASLAIEAAKKAGGNTFRVFSREMEMAVELRREMERAIGEGLQKGWFELHFQPQYDLGTKRLTGFEALARLHHPQLGEVPPTQFVPIADQSGLIHPLGEWIIHQALGTAATWPSHMTLSINISLAQFRIGDVAGTILHALSNTGFQAERLRVELSEAVLLEDSDAINEQLKRLKKRGVSIVLDDFGLDTSKLQLLSSSACDAVKLDRTLVSQVGEVPEMEHLLKSLIGTAQSFHLDILAEGVERAEQAQFLMSNDCKKVQGYLFGRPVAASDLAAIIAKDTRNAMSEGKETGPLSSSSAVA
jgi:diguanylate cyclase (GGDEF)-like protein